MQCFGLRIRKHSLDVCTWFNFFLGGWLSPIDVYPLNLIPGAVWMIIKILILFFMFAI